MESILKDKSQGLIAGEHEMSIYYEDTDFSGFVYHSNYLKFFERAREHLIGIDFLKELYELGIHFVVSQAQLNFRRPAKHGDRLLIRSEVFFSRSPILKAQQTAVVKGEDGEVLLVEGQVKLATLNLENRPIRLPDLIVERFLSQGRYL